MTTPPSRPGTPEPGSRAARSWPRHPAPPAPGRGARRATDPGATFMQEIPFRQVHLDFHTSEQIPGVGSEFDPARFVETLQRAAVNSITLFSRCHHGMIYHDTQFANLR